MKLFKITLLALLIYSLPSFADDSTSASGAGVSAKIEKINSIINSRFTKADADKDGTLTLTEAQNGMPRVAKNFAAIDAASTGKVTIDQIKSFMNAQFEAKQASK